MPGKVADKRKSIVAIKQKPRGYEDDITERPFEEDADRFQDRTIAPPDQLKLTAAELNEDITRILTANNPHAPQNIVRFNFKEGQYKPIPQIDQIAVHFQIGGNLLHKDTDEARRQLGKQGVIFEETEGGATTEEIARAESAKNKKYTNQFNFCERATQTINNPLRNAEITTEPLPRANFSATVNQWVIHDSYAEDYNKSQAKTKKENKPTFTRGTETKAKKKLTIHDYQDKDSLERVSHATKILERMVNQNTYDEIAQDFKYWEDPSDEFREAKGTLLPLWRFTYEKGRKLAITSLCWSPKYHDLVAVSYGSYDFMKEVKGLVCFYSTKNPSFPEYVVEAPSGVLTVDIHPEQPHMICVGLYNGAVAVYNILAGSKINQSLYISTAENGKHSDPVWQVKWQRQDFDNNLNFFSVSSDGRVTRWTLVKNDLMHNDIITLRRSDEPQDGPDGTKLKLTGCGTAIDFCPTSEHIFLVGTEEGLVHKCSCTYNSQYLETYEAHHMAVYRVAWNPFHPTTFITCSADWTVKIWDTNKNYFK